MSAIRGTSPSFQLYASDLMTRMDYRLMTLAERGLLLSMWCECWANTTLPASPADLSALLGKDAAGALTPRVLAFFENFNGSLISPDLEAYRARVVDMRKRMSDGGRKGGTRRAENEKKASHPSSHPASHPSEITQATLKGREHEPEPELEHEPENQSLGGAGNSLDDPWLHGYKEGERQHVSQH